jgi:2-amino-4-hydroxy-6-hydroxymethyldihydropteridine diphosphokinase
VQEEIVYLGLGSNLGDRAAHLHAGLTGLRRRGLRLLTRSSFYLTEPDLRSSAVGAPGEATPDGDTPLHPWYLNCVAAFGDAPPPHRLLRLCLEVESDEGRTREETMAGSNGGAQPRTLDVDILLIGDRVIDEPDLQVPHPRMAGRRFVLQPLAEIAPELVHPLTGQSIAATLAELPQRERVTLFHSQPGKVG